jgi:hypothetical protein
MSRDEPSLSVTYCQKSGKVMFHNRRKAKLFARKRTRTYGKRYSVYKCSTCETYHLTTKRSWRSVIEPPVEPVAYRPAPRNIKPIPSVVNCGSDIYYKNWVYNYGVHPRNP